MTSLINHAHAEASEVSSWEFVNVLGTTVPGIMLDELKWDNEIDKLKRLTNKR